MATLFCISSNKKNIYIYNILCYILCLPNIFTFMIEQKVLCSYKKKNNKNITHFVVREVVTTKF